MATKPREKLNFDLGQASPSPQPAAQALAVQEPPQEPPPPKAVARSVVPKASVAKNSDPKTADAMPRKAVATRLPTDLYRQAKARAALDDVTIQAVIESALREYVANAGAKSATSQAAA